MKSKTSFFNPTVLRKDITRFAPLWGLYTVFMLMTLFSIWVNETGPDRFAAVAPNVTRMMGVVNLIYGGLCALCLFGDLFSGKMAGMLHAMPMRREGWFLTHLTSGMLFCIVPNTLGAVLACLILQQYCYLAFLWLAVMILQFTFFFGVGAFSAQCAGNKLGAMGVYTLINFLAVLVGFLITTFYQPVLYGVVINTEGIFRCSPVVDFSESSYMEVVLDNMRQQALFEGLNPNDWRYLLISAVVGVGFLAVAVVLYRRRQMENAGDLIAFKPAGPVFLVIYTLSVGAVMHGMSEIFGTGIGYLFLVLGFAIGFITGYMLLEKKVNVFTLKRWIGLGVLTVVFFLTIAIVSFDPIGITRYVPREDQIRKVHFSPYAPQWYLDDEPVVLTESQDIETIVRIHEKMTQDRTASKYDEVCLNLRYYLKDGRTVERQYYMDIESEESKILEHYCSQFSYVVGAESVDTILKNASYLEFVSHTGAMPNIVFSSDIIPERYEEEDWMIITVDDMYSSAEVRGLLEAIKADCEAGNMAQQWDFRRDEEHMGTLQINSKNYFAYEAKGITVFEGCTNTVEYLQLLVKIKNMEKMVTPPENTTAESVPEEAVPTEPMLAGKA